MISLFTSAIRKVLLLAGYDVIPHHQPDFDASDLAAVQRVLPNTMTSVQRLMALRTAVRYISQHRIVGDLVECGVWKGGSMMMAALTLLECGDEERHLYLYDTFEGMSAPTDKDQDYQGNSADKLLATESKNSLIWAASPLNVVKAGMESTKYPSERIHYVQGKVEETIPATIPERIAILRLDTDWYESTYHEMVHLFPRLVRGGVLIIDDYGHWEGARKAIDQYLSEKQITILLNRIDYTGRIAVKITD